MLRVLINVIDNAIKYNEDSGGQIHITVVREGARTVLSIANIGKVVPSQELPYVFQQFYRVEWTTITLTQPMA